MATQPAIPIRGNGLVMLLVCKVNFELLEFVSLFVCILRVTKIMCVLEGVVLH